VVGTVHDGLKCGPKPGVDQALVAIAFAKGWRRMRIRDVLGTLIRSTFNVTDCSTSFVTIILIFLLVVLLLIIIIIITSKT
jgi:hypothetical protein